VEERERWSLPLRSVLLRGLPLAVICAAGCAVLAGLMSSEREPVYSATALVLMRSSADPANPDAAPRIEGEGVATQSLLVARRPVLERVSRRMPDASVGELEAAVSVHQVPKTDATRVTAEARRSAQAAEIANRVAATYVSVERANTMRRAEEARRALGKQLRSLSAEAREHGEGATLRQRIQDLRVLEQVGSPAPRVAERAVAPSRAMSPQPKRDALFGGIFGFVLGIGLGVLWVASDRRIRDPAEASQVLGVPALATVPRRRFLIGWRGERRRAEEQAWQLLHLGLRSGPDGRPLRTVSVTTLGLQPERSRVAYGLAATAAASGQRALLISMEPQRKSLNGSLRNASGDRLRALLAGDATLSEAASTVEMRSKQSGQLDVVLGDGADGGPAAEMNAARLGDAIRDAATSYELVVIDTPSVFERVEGLPVVSAADGTVVVLPAHADRDDVVALRGRLEALRAHVVGVVLGRS
jgi:capsular polysaccharide biosynthesis protein/Mrp family chromosome partitioning ATPase